MDSRALLPFSTWFSASDLYSPILEASELESCSSGKWLRNDSVVSSVKRLDRGVELVGC